MLEESDYMMDCIYKNCAHNIELNIDTIFDEEDSDEIYLILYVFN